MMRDALTFALALALAPALVLAAGCRIPEEPFRATPDGGPDALAIVPSATALTVDENGTEELTVTLSQPPPAPLTVQVDSPSTAIVLTVPDLTFDAASFDQPRTILVTGLADINVADAQAEITLSAAGLPPVAIAATVEDPDIVALVTSLGSNTTINVDDGQFVDLDVHLSHQPEGDVTVQAILGAGPCTVDRDKLVFRPDNHDVDQRFRFRAAIDANAMDDTQTLTLRVGDVDRELTLREIDGDELKLTISPDPLDVDEQGSAGNLNVALTRQPPGNVTVNIAVVSQTGAVTVDRNQLTFTPQNYATNQTVKVTGAADADIDDDTAKVVFTPGGSIPAREVVVNIDDDDAQEILEDAVGTLSVDEDAEIAFGVFLSHEPATNLTVAVQSLAAGVATVTQGGVLTFTPQNYATPQTVRVKGTRDGNLATSSTRIRLFAGTLLTEVGVDVTDVDVQELVVTPPALTVAEGGQGSFTVALRYQPASTVSAMISSTSAALPVGKTSLTFTTANHATPQTVTVDPPVDTNAVGETATITISGAGAPQPKTLLAMVNDSTDIDLWGWPMPFPATTTIGAGAAVAYRIDVGAVGNLASLHTYVPTPTGAFRMALYTDAGNVPGTLVAEMPAGQTVVSGANTGAVPNGPVLDKPTYFLAIRFSADVNIGYAPIGTTGRQCARNLLYSTIQDPWSSSFGGHSCTTARLMNLWITTYHQ